MLGHLEKRTILTLCVRVFLFSQYANVKYQQEKLIWSEKRFNNVNVVRTCRSEEKCFPLPFNSTFEIEKERKMKKKTRELRIATSIHRLNSVLYHKFVQEIRSLIDVLFKVHISCFFQPIMLRVAYKNNMADIHRKKISQRGFFS